MINQKLRNTVKLSDKKAYEIAHKAGLHPSTLSRIICGIEKVKPGDPRVIAIGRVLGFSKNECFEKNDQEYRNE